MLFEPHNPNDPIMINPRGAEVQIKEEKVIEFLQRGFVLKDQSWMPSPPEDDSLTRTVPRRLAELKKEMGLKQDLLEVVEV